VRELKEQLQQSSYNISSQAYDQPGSDHPGSGQPGGGQGAYKAYGGNGHGQQSGTATENGPSDEDVIDAEFSER
jgi:hypothetical protein